MAEKCCCNCKHWRYDRWLEEKYGMGVGVCELDNTERFCDHHNCLFHSEEDI